MFGSNNFVGLISFQTTSGFAQADGISRMGDYLLWYGKDREQTTTRTLYEIQDIDPGTLVAGWLLTPEGGYRGVTAAEAEGRKAIPEGSRLYNPDNLQSQGAASKPQPFDYQGKRYEPGANNHWKPKANK